MPGQRSLSSETFQNVVQALLIGGTYIPISAGLISFNKYLMTPGRFPHATALTSLHMMVTVSLGMLLYLICPQFYPSMDKARSEITSVVKYLVPIAACFAVALYASNAAYIHCTVAFLQFCKEGNVPLLFFGACLLGLQKCDSTKIIIICIILAGCTMCIHGEIRFSWFGFALQIISQFAEISRNLLAEIVLTGAGLKLDVLTFVTFQAPLALVPLTIATVLHWTPQIGQDFVRMWPLLLCNALLAFILNVMIAIVLKKLSATSFVIIGIIKDVFIVTSSAMIFGDTISTLQQVGFVVTLAGIAAWGHNKIQEQEEQKKDAPLADSEKQPLVSKHDQKSEDA